MTTIDRDKNLKLPPELTERLGLLIRRVRRIQWIRGLAASAGGVFILLLLLMAIDAAVVIPRDGVRVVLSCAGFLLAASCTYFSLIRPLMQPLSPVRMARILETRHPELQEKISSALELLGEGGDAARFGSAQLLEILASDAGHDISAFTPDEEFRGATQKPAILALAIGAGLMLILLIIWPRQTSLLFLRTVAPAAELDNLAAADLRITPGSKTVERGSALEITLAARNDCGERAMMIPDGNEEAAERMRRLPDRDGEARFSLVIPAVEKSFTYRIRFGAALTRRYKINVVPPPAHGEIKVDFLFPQYMQRPPTQHIAKLPQAIRVPENTHITLTTLLNRPLTSQLLIGKSSRAPETRGAEKRNPLWSWNAATSDEVRQWTLSLRDEFGFTNNLQWANYEITPDRTPTVRLVFPDADNYKIPTYSTLRLVFDFSDDFGYTKSTLAVKSDDEVNPWYFSTEPEEIAPRRWRVVYELSLAEFQLSGAKNLRIWLEVADNKPEELGGPNVAMSRVIALTLNDAFKKSLADQVRQPQHAAISNLLEKAAAELEAAQKALAAATNAAAKAEALVNNPPAANAEDAQAEKQAQDAEEKAAAALETMQEARDKAAESLFAGMTPELKVAIEEFIPAFEETEAIDLHAEDRDEQAERALTALQNAAEQTKELLKELAKKDELLAKAAEIDAIATRERALAKAAEKRQMTAEEMNTWQTRQNEIAAETAAEQNENAETSEVAQTVEKANEAMESAAKLPQDEKAIAALRDAENTARRTQKAAEDALAAAEANLKHDAAEELIKQQLGAIETAKRVAEETRETAKKIEEIAEEIAQERALAADSPREETVAEKLAEGLAQSLEQVEAARQAAAENNGAKARELARNAEADAAEQATQARRALDAMSEEEKKTAPLLAENLAQAENAAKQIADAAAKTRSAVLAAENPTATENEKIEKSAQALEATSEAKRAAEKVGEVAELTAMTPEEAAEKLRERAVKSAEETLALAEQLQKAIDEANEAAGPPEQAVRREAALDNVRAFAQDAAEKKDELEAAEKIAKTLGEAKVAAAANEQLARAADSLAQAANFAEANDAEKSAAKMKEAIDTANGAKNSADSAAPNAAAQSPNAADSSAENARAEEQKKSASSAINAADEAIENLAKLEKEFKKSEKNNEKVADILNDAAAAAETLRDAAEQTNSAASGEAADRGAEGKNSAASADNSDAAEEARLSAKLAEEVAQEAGLLMQELAEELSRAESAAMERTKKAKDAAQAAETSANRLAASGAQETEKFAEEVAKAAALTKESAEKSEAATSAQSGEKSAANESPETSASSGGETQSAEKSAANAASATSESREDDEEKSAANGGGGSRRQNAQEAKELAREARSIAAAAAQSALEAQAPTDEQKEAARQANKAAQLLRKLADEQAALAGLDPLTMLPERAKEDEKSREPKFKMREGKAPQEKEPGGGGENDEEYEIYEEESEIGEMPEFFKLLGFPFSRWLRFKRSLDTGMLEDALRHVPAEYRELVRQYYLELAKELKK